jgi:hypothetical protein
MTPKLKLNDNNNAKNKQIISSRNYVKEMKSKPQPTYININIQTKHKKQTHLNNNNPLH